MERAQTYIVASSLPEIDVPADHAHNVHAVFDLFNPLVGKTCYWTPTLLTLPACRQEQALILRDRVTICHACDIVAHFPLESSLWHLLKKVRSTCI